MKSIWRKTWACVLLKVLAIYAIVPFNTIIMENIFYLFVVK